jgi:hypothetical protein
MKILVVGHSHLQCVREALDDVGPALAAQGWDFETVQLREPRFAPELVPDAAAPLGHRLAPALQAEIERLAPRCDASFLMVAGNAHNGLGLFEHPRPFDFVSEQWPELPLDPARELVPAAVVAGSLQRWEPFALPNLLRRLLLPLLPGPWAQSDSPPPIGCNDDVMALLDDARRCSERARLGLAPAHLRFKIWGLHSRLLAAECASAGIDFVPVPAASQDESGCLAAHAWGADATHANAWYGRRVIEQMLGWLRPGLKLQALQR